MRAPQRKGIVQRQVDLPEGEVTIEQREGGLFISTRRGQWQRFFDELQAIDLVDELKEVRATLPARDVENIPDL